VYRNRYQLINKFQTESLKPNFTTEAKTYFIVPPILWAYHLCLFPCVRACVCEEDGDEL
jgi:hypothetical protein